MNFLIKNKCFVVFVLLVSQAFASSPMEEGESYSDVQLRAMKSVLEYARIDYNDCCSYAKSSTMKSALRGIIKESESLSVLPMEWKKRFFNHIVFVSNMENTEFNDFLSQYRFHEYSNGARTAYIKGINEINIALRALYEKLKGEAEKSEKIEQYRRSKYVNTATDSDHWTIIDDQ